MDYIIARHRIRLEGEGTDNPFARALKPFTAADGTSQGTLPGIGSGSTDPETPPTLGTGSTIPQASSSLGSRSTITQASQSDGNRNADPEASLSDSSRSTAPEAPPTLVLDLRINCEIDLAEYDYTELDAFGFDDADADCHFGRYADGYIFRMAPRDGGAETLFVSRHGSALVRSNIREGNVAMYRFGLWMMFGVAVNPLHTIAVHSSVIRRGDGAVMFLGESGTGKSTHTRLWREHIEGAVLLNDDSPIVRMADGVATVFGSPWSGKTPCYKNESCPIRAVVRLSQAPHNKIRRLPTILAVGALLPSCPPAFAYDDTLQDNTCATLSELIASVPAYHLECLPDEAAAQLSFNTAFHAVRQ